jgi:hypothetical protein
LDKIFSISKRLKNPKNNPVHAKDKINNKSYQTGILRRRRKCNKSVKIYGALGKNNSQNISIMPIAILYFWIFSLIIRRLLNAHGINAKNKFQFKKINPEDPV